VIFGFRVGIGPVFAGDVGNRAVVRGRRQNGDKVLHNKIGNLALFFGRQRSNFIQNRLGFYAHDLTIPAQHEIDKHIIDKHIM